MPLLRDETPYRCRKARVYRWFRQVRSSGSAVPRCVRVPCPPPKWQACSPAKPSSAPWIISHCASSSIDGSATRGLRVSPYSTRPSNSSWRIASRTGVRLMPRMSERSRSFSGSPGGSFSRRISSRSFSAASSARLGRLSVERSSDSSSLSDIDFVNLVSPCQRSSCER